ncbi:hypothetical protein [Helicobacter sp. T3_23-1056]
MDRNWDNLPYGEVIYEFKYEFPKKPFNRFARILDRVSWIIATCVFVYLAYFLNEEFLLPTLDNIWAMITKYSYLLTKISNMCNTLLWLIIVFMSYVCIIIFSFCAINILFIMPRNQIFLTNKGMFVMATHLLGLWRKKRLYPYGSFSLAAHLIGGNGTLENHWQFRVCDDIDKKFSFFDFRHSRFYCIAQNNEIQDMRKFLAILRERSAEALESQGKAGKYDLKDKIKHLHRKDL